MTVPIVVTPGGGADSTDYTVSAATVTFDSDDAEATFTVTAVDDTVWDGEGNGETLTLSFGTLPSGVSPGEESSADVSLVDNEIPLDFELVPDDAELGDGFRLLFVTSGERDAFSSKIADYNEFVQRAAASGRDDIRPYSSLFRALASTNGKAARDNTATTHTPSAPGLPIWWLNGPRAANDYADFYDGNWDHGDPAYNEDGTVELEGSPCDASDAVWTGSSADGDREANRTLGFTTTAIAGRPCAPGKEIFDERTSSGNHNSLYGLSGRVVRCGPRCAACDRCRGGSRACTRQVHRRRHDQGQGDVQRAGDGVGHAYVPAADRLEHPATRRIRPTTATAQTPSWCSPTTSPFRSPTQTPTASPTPRRRSTCPQTPPSPARTTALCRRSPGPSR